MSNDAIETLSKKELSEKIGQKIKQLRKAKGISQAELARICGKDKQHLELIENSKVAANIYTLYLISIALEIKLKELFDL